MKNVFAEADEWKAEQLQSRAEAAEFWRQNAETNERLDKLARFHAKRWENLKHRFRELPPSLAEACYRDARKWTRDLKGLSPLAESVQVALDWLEEQQLGPDSPARWRLMCPADRAMIVALGTVRMPVASAAKRLRRHLLEQHAKVPALITEPQAVKLRELVTTFRRQIRPELLPSYTHWLLNNHGAKR